jgi:putative membrane protein
MTMRQLLLSTWDWNPILVGICLVALLSYAELTPGRRLSRSGCFFAGVAVLFLTLASPVNFLAAGYLFSAHMLQHLLLLLVVPPLLLLGLPEWEIEPAETAACFSRERGNPLGRFLARFRIHPFAAWLAGLSAMWIWHERSLCDVATTTQTGRVIQIISLVVLGTLFWWPIVGPQMDRRLAPPLGIVYLFSACVGCTILGILITFAPAGAVCPAFLHPLDRLGVLPLVREQWGITLAKDQQIGGLMMWVPACGIYLSGVITLLARWYRSAETTFAEPQKTVNEPAPVFSSARTTRERA